jgi:hypothetical protein
LPAAETVQQLPITLQEPTRSGGEILVAPDEFDLGSEGVNDQLIHTGPPHSGRATG